VHSDGSKCGPNLLNGVAHVPSYFTNTAIATLVIARMPAAW
jgi:hypothetical protein